jgi:hypothetical protein
MVLMSEQRCALCDKQIYADYVRVGGETVSLCNKHYRDMIEEDIRYRAIKDNPDYRGFIL